NYWNGSKIEQVSTDASALFLHSTLSRCGGVALQRGYVVAPLQKKSDSWYLQFMYRKQRFTFTVGKVEEDEAHAVKGRVEYLLMRIKQHLLDIPAGMDIGTFLQFDGKPPDTHREPQKKATSFIAFREAYLNTFGNGAVEANTLSTARIHLTHLAGTLGED